MPSTPLPALPHACPHCTTPLPPPPPLAPPVRYITLGAECPRCGQRWLAFVTPTETVCYLEPAPAGAREE